MRENCYGRKGVQVREVEERCIRNATSAYEENGRPSIMVTHDEWESWKRINGEPQGSQEWEKKYIMAKSVIAYQREMQKDEEKW